MSPVKTKDKKVEVSFTNWALGGSLLTVTSTEEDWVNNVPRRSASRKVIVTEVDSVSVFAFPSSCNDGGIGEVVGDLFG